MQYDKKYRPSKLTVTQVVLYGCQKSTSTLTVKSPSGTNELQISPNVQGSMYYPVIHNGEVLVDTSYVGYELKDQPALGKDLTREFRKYFTK